jgi:hypothetical protein
MIDDGRGIKTKYGRKVHAPQQFQPTPSIPYLHSTLLIVGTSRKRRLPDETHFCHQCSRSSSQGSNKLVFCDNCDAPYHQHCHSPPVSDAAVAANIKWFCSDCKPPPLLDTLQPRLIGQMLSDEQVL